MADITKAQLAELIRAFVDGSAGDWDWDDFTSVKQSDPEIEKIRLQLNDIPDMYPPKKSNEYCNDEGEKAMLEIADLLLRK